MIKTGGSPEGVNEELVGAVKRYLDAALFPLRAELLAVKTELEALKSRPEPLPGRDGLPGAPGPAGRDGEHGADGLGFEHIQIDYDGARKFTFRAVRGERVKEAVFVVPVPLYREVFKEGTTYWRGDMCSFGGSLWHCNERMTATKPGNGNPHWTLCVKHGRDGKNGQSAYEVAVDRGFKGSETEWLKSLRGPEGPRGQDLRHLMPGGA